MAPPSVVPRFDRSGKASTSVWPVPEFTPALMSALPARRVVWRNHDLDDPAAIERLRGSAFTGCRIGANAIFHCRIQFGTQPLRCADDCDLPAYLRNPGHDAGAVGARTAAAGATSGSTRWHGLARVVAVALVAAAGSPARCRRRAARGRTLVSPSPHPARERGEAQASLQTGRRPFSECGAHRCRHSQVRGRS